MNETTRKPSKIWDILAFAAGCFSVFYALNLYLMPSVLNQTIYSAKFGADFYTEIYDIAALNLRAIIDQSILLSRMGSLAFFLAGIVDICVFGKKLFPGKEKPASVQTETVPKEEKPVSPQTKTVPKEEKPVSPQTKTVPKEEKPVSPQTETVPKEEKTVSPQTEAVLKEEKTVSPQTEAVPEKEKASANADPEA